MYKRESFINNFLLNENDKYYLSFKTQNVRIIVIHGKNINIGNKSLIRKGDKIILMYKHRDNLLVSIIRYEGNTSFIEESSRLSKVDESIPTFPELQEVFPDMEDPAILYNQELYM